MAQARTHNALAWELRDPRPDSALYHASIAVKIADENEYSREAIQGINYMGVAHRNLSNYSEAYAHYIEALRRAEEAGDGEQIGYSLINIGNLYGYQTNFSEAIGYFQRALEQAEELSNQRMLGYCYVNLGRAFRGLSDYGQSEQYFVKALELRRQLKDDHGVKAAQIDLAELYRLEGDLDKALTYSLTVADSLNTEKDSRTLVDLYNTIARIYLEKGLMEEAESYGLRALPNARAYDSPYDEKEILLTLSETYKAMGQYDKALENHEQYAQLEQKLFSEESIRRIAQLQNQQRIQQQQAQNEINEKVIEQQRITLIFSITGFVLFVILAAIIYRAYVMRSRLSTKIQRQKDKIEKDKSLIEQQSHKLEELDAAKSRFFANVSHDLRSPLSLILGNLEMIAEDESNTLSPQSKKSLEVGFKNSKRLLYLTDEINDITRLEEGKIELKPEKVKINSYLQLLCEMFKATADYKGVELLFHTEVSDTTAMSIDPRQFEKIFYNLVSNAIRHTQKGEKIEIGVAQDHGEMVITFEDTGEGIAKESLPFLFDRFYQSKGNKHKTREGLGIGLALVKELVTLHNASIEVSSVLSEGTKFTIRFHSQPLREVGNDVLVPTGTYLEKQSDVFKDLEVGVKVNTNVNVGGHESQRTVLIVDDHPEIRYYLRQILEHDFQVVEASHGLEAIDLLRAKSIDVIVTDLMMPWMDGFELIEALSEDQKLQNIPLLVVSARISEDTMEKVLSLGVNEFLQKPFQKKELLLRIENLLNQKTKFSTQPADFIKDLENEVHVTSLESSILERLEKVVKESIDDPRLSVLQLADAMAASERQVYRLVKKITGLTPHEYITEVRMQYVDYLIRNNMVKNATEAARRVGQRNVTTFSRQFRKKYGMKPADLLKG